MPLVPEMSQSRLQWRRRDLNQPLVGAVHLQDYESP